MLENATVVKIHSYKEHPEVKETVDLFLDYNKIYLKACYANAYAMASMTGDFKYILGQAPSLIPIDHAWNSFEGFHFDLTNEILHKGKAFSSEYVMFKEFTAEEVSAVTAEIPDLVPDIWFYLNQQRRKSDQSH